MLLLTGEGTAQAVPVTVLPFMVNNSMERFSVKSKHFGNLGMFRGNLWSLWISGNFGFNINN
jgi:hypothetical protein